MVGVCFSEFIGQVTFCDHSFIQQGHIPSKLLIHNALNRAIFALALSWYFGQWVCAYSMPLLLYGTDILLGLLGEDDLVEGNKAASFQLWIRCLDRTAVELEESQA